ncbi:MAG TPA: hypothetical protein VFE91_02330 [Nitrososphaerales archaeon]|nr:hypothetical protein [Nitrososphaerales archaeon]
MRRASTCLLVVAALTFGVQAAVAQSSNSTASATSSVQINSVNFDFGTAAAATMVLVLLGLTALFIVLAKYANKMQKAGA